MNSSIAELSAFLKQSWDEPEAYYHGAPTTERQRILQHGLQPSDPGWSKNWTNDDPLERGTPNGLRGQPTGVYMTDQPDTAYLDRPGATDLWHIDPAYLSPSALRPDREWGSDSYIHPTVVPPEALSLHDPAEETMWIDHHDRQQTQQTQHGPELAQQFFDYKQQHAQGNPWGIGQPTAHTWTVEPDEPAPFGTGKPITRCEKCWGPHDTADCPLNQNPTVRTADTWVTCPACQHDPKKTPECPFCDRSGVVPQTFVPNVLQALQPVQPNIWSGDHVGKTADNYTQDTREWPDPTEPRASKPPSPHGCTCEQGLKLECPIHGMQADPNQEDMGWAVPETNPVNFPQDQPRSWSQAVSAIIKEWPTEGHEGYEGRRPTIYDPQIDTLHVGPDGASHWDLGMAAGIGYPEQGELPNGWIGPNPERHLRTDLNEREHDPVRWDTVRNKSQPNELGWYRYTPQPPESVWPQMQQLADQIAPVAPQAPKPFGHGRNVLDILDRQSRRLNSFVSKTVPVSNPLTIPVPEIHAAHSDANEIGWQPHGRRSRLDHHMGTDTHPANRIAHTEQSLFDPHNSKIARLNMLASDQLQWEPGQPGKGSINHKFEVRTWPTDNFGQPSHARGTWPYRNADEFGAMRHFEIKPDGQLVGSYYQNYPNYNGTGRMIPLGIANQADPRLRIATNRGGNPDSYQTAEKNAKSILKMARQAATVAPWQSSPTLSIGASNVHR